MIDGKALENVVDEYFASRRKIYPCHTNRASEIGHSCLRYLQLARVRWQDKMLHDVALEYIFQEGVFQERATEETLRAAGFILTESQRAHFDAPNNISGHLDDMIGHPKYIPQPVPSDIKSMSVANWTSINSYEDIVNHKHWYVRKYPGQIQIYMYMSEREWGLFILKNKSTGRMKFIPCELDYEYTEKLLKKAERVNEWVRRYVDDKEVCDETTEDPRICASCPFNHICFKDDAETGAPGFSIIENALVEQNLYRMEEIKGAYDEYVRIKKEVDDLVKGRADKEFANHQQAHFIINDWAITMKKITSTKYNVPKEIKKDYAEKFTYWKYDELEKLN